MGRIGSRRQGGERRVEAHALAKRLRDGTDGTLCMELFPALADALRLWFNLSYDSAGPGFAEEWIVHP